MNSYKLSLILNLVFLIGFLSVQSMGFSQSKKKQIEALNFKIDSINKVIQKDRYSQKSEISSLEIQESKTKHSIDSLNLEIKTVENQISLELNEKQKKEQEIVRLKNEIDTNKDSLEDLIKSQIVKWEIDTLESPSKKTKCFSFRNGPYLLIESAPIEDSIIKIINKDLEKLKSKIPELLNGREKTNFIGDCKEWLDQLCDRPWFVSNDIESLNTKKYFSVLQMSQLEYCGGNWAARGYSSYNYNLNSGEEIIIMDNQQTKQIIQDEIKNHFEKLETTDPYFDTQFGKIIIEYDKILREILNFPISKLTFYFNDDILSIVYYHYVDSWSNRKLIIPLPQLQKSLSL
jgi:hypothetical protein